MPSKRSQAKNRSGATGRTQSRSSRRKFDPITLEILWRRLVSIVDEADASVARTAFSSLLRDAHDYTCMFTDSRGQELFREPSAHRARQVPWRWG